MPLLDPLGAGDPVEVHVAYNDAWSSGFEVAAVVEGGYQLRRQADHSLLPGPTGPDDVRRPAGRTSL